MSSKKRVKFSSTVGKAAKLASMTYAESKSEQKENIQHKKNAKTTEKFSAKQLKEEMKKAKIEEKLLEKQLREEIKKAKIEERKQNEEKKKAKIEEQLLAKQLREEMKKAKIEEQLLAKQLKEDMKKAKIEEQLLAKQLKEENKIAKAEEKILAKQLKAEAKQARADEKKARAEEKKAMIEEENEIRREKAIKSMNYLLKNSEKLSKYFLDKLNENGATTLNHKGKKPLQEKNCNKNTFDLKTEEILKMKNQLPTKSEGTKPVVQLKYFKGTLHPYQVDGLNWLKVLYENSINGILADEMGLGKTIQVIALICHLVEQRVNGPFLVMAPLSTLPNWLSEFKKFAPKIPVLIFHGGPEQRNQLYSKIKKIYSVDDFMIFPVVLITFQLPLQKPYYLRNFRWHFIIIDEGHRIKNFKCKLIDELKKLKSHNRLILTGTPLQNNLAELWSLLNFLLPQIFENMATFDALFDIEDFIESEKITNLEKNTQIISTIHGVLKPFMLRRLKADVLQNLAPKKHVLVYCPLSEFQEDLYRFVLQKNFAKLSGKENKNEDDVQIDLTKGRKKRKCTESLNNKWKEPESDDEFDEYDGELDNSSDLKNDKYIKTISEKDKKAFIYQINMSNPVMIMKKIVNHPFTVHYPVVPGTRNIIINEDIVTKCGKMMVLDAMLSKLKKTKHKVLLFCTLTSVLDFIEDYLLIRNYQYCRLDGTTDLESRQNSIEAFNNDPEKFIFIISTRAGGLGLNLVSADTVIFYDRDWNPQVDIQAQDRCHRIGQTKPVLICSLVAKGTIDEKIITCGTAKRRLEKIVIQNGKFKKAADSLKLLTDLKELQELLNSVDHKQVIHSNGFIFTDEELQRILDRSDLIKEMEEKNIN